MIITPQQFTDSHKEEVQLESPITEEIIKKIIANNNWLLDLMPIGSIVFIQTNQDGASTPDSNVWQYCDGSEITNSESPIRTIGLNQRFVPDLRGKFPRGANSLSSNPTGGSWSHGLQHAHNTGDASSFGPDMKSKGNRRRRDHHTHTVFAQYPEVTTLEKPAYIQYNAYMKIS